MIHPMTIQIRYAIAPRIAADDVTAWDWRTARFDWEPYWGEEDYRNWEVASEWQEQLVAVLTYRRELTPATLLVDAAATLHNPDGTYRAWRNRSWELEEASWDYGGMSW